jgi:hypothetical protein
MFRPSLFNAAIVAADTVWLSTTAFGQSSSRGNVIINRGFSSQGSSGRVVQQAQTFEDKFWRYLRDSHYKQWAPVPGKTDDLYPGQSPHGATLKMYLNRKAAGRPAELPNGSVIVKENYVPTGQKLVAVTVMYKTPNYNPDAGDWYWVKYLVDQKVTPTGNIRLAGKPKGCIECHAGADGGDYAFFNDAP